MSDLTDFALHELIRLKAISRKLSELRLPAIKDDTDQLQIVIWAMQHKLQSTAASSTQRLDQEKTTRALHQSHGVLRYENDSVDNRNSIADCITPDMAI